MSFEKYFVKSNDSMCLCSRDGVVRQVNPTWKALFGCQDDITGQSVLDFLHPEDAENWRKWYSAGLVEELVPGETCTVRWQHGKGHYIWAEVSLSLFDDTVLLNCRDVTEVKNRSFALDKIQETAKIGYWSVELAVGNPWWSPGTYRIHEVENEEEFDLAGAIDFYVGDSKKRITEDFANCASEGTPFDEIYRFRDAKDNEKWVRSVGHATKDSGDNIVIVSGIFQDVTEATEAEREIRSVRDRLSLAIEASGIGVWEYDLVSQVMLFDAKMFDIYGISAESFSGAYAAWSKMLHCDDKLRVEQELQEAVDNNLPFDTEFRIQWPDGTIRNIKAIGQLIRDDKGKKVKVLGVNWDITTFREQQILLEEAKDRAERANHSKSLFLSNMSHEIRTPMNGILGFLDLLLESDLSNEQRRQIEIIQQSGTSLLSLINDILDYSKIESGHLKIQTKESNLSKLLADIKNIFVATIGDKQLKLTFIHDFKDEDLLVIDSLRVNQILTNLIGNAVKFTKDGFIELRVDYNEDTQSIDFQLTDTGIGISEKGIERIFDPFERIDDQDNFVEGTGLGLSIVKKLLELMHGKIRCKSQLDKGTTFWISIPARKAVSSAARCELNPVTSGKKDFSHLKILVVDDNMVNQTLAIATLGKFGVEPQVASDGYQAIDMVANDQYDLIFMDIKMPGIDGYVTTERIRKLSIQQPKIIALTAQAFEEDRARALESGMDSYISKPYKKADIEQALKSLISNKLAS